jgi:hypothetical protein
VAYFAGNLVMLRVLVLLTAGVLPSPNAARSPASHPFVVGQNQDSAEPSRLELDWAAPAGCPAGDAVRSDALRLAGATADGSRHLKARASIRPAAKTGWTLSLATDLDGVVGERSLSGMSCESLAEAAALMLALILNPELAISAPPAAPPPPPPPPAVVPERWPHPRWRLGAHGGIQTGTIQELSSAFALTLGVAWGRLSLRLMPGFSLPQDVYVDSEQGLGGRLWLGSAAALGCWSAALGWMALSPCLGVEVTRMKGRGLGVLQPRATSVYWSSAELGLFAGLPVGHGVHLELGALGILPLHRPTVYLDEIGRVSRPSVLGVKALGGLAWLF